MLQDLLTKYQSLTTKQQVWSAIAVFILALLILPNFLVYGAAIFASKKLIQEGSFRRIFITVFSVVTFFSFVLLFADDTPEESVVPATEPPAVVETPTQETEPEVVERIATSTPTITAADAEIIEEESVIDVVEEAVTIPLVTPSEPTPEPEEVIPPVQENDSFKVVSVVDGDTVKLDMNGTTETIRLIGIDTPETVHPQKPVECMGTEASNQAKQLLTGQTVRFESDDSQDARDRFGRLLGYVFLPNGDNFAEVMIRSGYGNEYTYTMPYKYQASFKSAEQYAQSNQLGLWADGVCEEEEESGPEPVAVLTSDGSKWYVSSHYSSKFYYCENSDDWKGLSPDYLEVYDSESALKANYPGHALHESCL